MWSGLHIGLKALPIVLHAMKKVRDESGLQTTLTVLGRGTATKRWMELAERLGVAKDVRWTGALPHEQAMAAYVELVGTLLASERP